MLWVMVPLRGDDTPTIGAPDVPPAPVAKTKAHDQGDDALFAGLVPHLQLTITSENIAKLLQNPRTLVPLTIKEVGGATYKNCSVKIKGSTGSFRPSIKTDPGAPPAPIKLSSRRNFGAALNSNSTTAHKITLISMSRLRAKWPVRLVSRPHSSLGYVTPSEFATKRRAELRQVLPTQTTQNQTQTLKALV